MARAKAKAKAEEPKLKRGKFKALAWKVKGRNGVYPVGVILEGLNPHTGFTCWIDAPGNFLQKGDVIEVIDANFPESFEAEIWKAYELKPEELEFIKAKKILKGGLVK